MIGRAVRGALGSKPGADSIGRAGGVGLRGSCPGCSRGGLCGHFRLVPSRRRSIPELEVWRGDARFAVWAASRPPTGHPRDGVEDFVGRLFPAAQRAHNVPAEKIAAKPSPRGRVATNAISITRAAPRRRCGRRRAPWLGATDRRPAALVAPLRERCPLLGWRGSASRRRC
jgi:hypothetical protein